MIKNNYPLLLISDLIDSIEKKVFMKIDLRWGYNNVRIKEEDEWKAVFSIPEGAFELTVMFFRLTNSPVTFQAITNYLLRDMIEAGDVAAFIDDVMVRTEMEEEHNDIMEEVLRRMTENDLFVKLEKCIQKIRKVGFLKVVIGPDEVKIEKKKVQGIVDWPVPRSVKDVQNFLGLVNYYRQFVKNFTRVAKFLHKMTRKDVKWNWGERQQSVFEELKKRFITELVLVTLDLDKKIRVEVDMPNFAIEEVLLMKCKDKKWRSVAYISKLLNEAERNYKIHDKEILVIIRYLEIWRLSQIRYLLVVILELNSVSEVQYKGMMTDI